MPIDIPSHIITGPRKDGIKGLTRGNPRGKGQKREILISRAFEKAAISGDRPVVIPVEVERMKVSSSTDHPDEDSFTGMHPCKGTIGLVREEGIKVSCHRIKSCPAIDKPVNGEDSCVVNLIGPPKSDR